MMPDQDLPSTPTSRAPATPPVQPTIVSTKPSLHDLFTGGWKRPLTGLPTALGRPLARGLGVARSRAAAWKTRTSEHNAQH
jgi:hypothetical protein